MPNKESPQVGVFKGPIEKLLDKVLEPKSRKSKRKEERFRINQEPIVESFHVAPEAIVANVVRKLKECDADLQLLPRTDMRIGGGIHFIRQAIAQVEASQWGNKHKQ